MGGVGVLVVFCAVYVVYLFYLQGAFFMFPATSWGLCYYCLRHIYLCRVCRSRGTSMRTSGPAYPHLVLVPACLPRVSVDAHGVALFLKMAPYWAVVSPVPGFPLQ